MSLEPAPKIKAPARTSKGHGFSRANRNKNRKGLQPLRPNGSMTPHEIELTTNRELRDGPFPYEDCHWLEQNKGANEDLIPDLDMYFSTIAGFGISASELERRQPEMLREQIQAYRPYLGLSFFERHAKYHHLEPDINESNTPKLFKELSAANQIRIALLPILDALLSNEENRKVTR